eukprot:SAG31_NODE_10107_length_1182_cov_1.136657_2_plen_52_part_00
MARRGSDASEFGALSDDEPTLAAIVCRMESLLENDFGATGAVVASANALQV